MSSISSYRKDTVENEIRKIKSSYCIKCVYFDGSCRKKKIYKKCFKNNERTVKKEDENEWGWNKRYD